MPRSLKILQDHITQVESQYDLLNEEMAKGENAGYGKESMSQTSGRLSGIYLLPQTISGPSVFLLMSGGGNQRTRRWTQPLLCLKLSKLDLIFTGWNWSKEKNTVDPQIRMLYSWLFQTCYPMSALLNSKTWARLRSSRATAAEQKVKHWPQVPRRLEWSFEQPVHQFIQESFQQISWFMLSGNRSSFSTRRKLAKTLIARNLMLPMLPSPPAESAVRTKNIRRNEHVFQCFGRMPCRLFELQPLKDVLGQCFDYFWLRNYRIYDVIGYVNLTYIMLSFCLATIPSNSSEAIRQPSPGSHAHIQALRTALHFWLGTSFNSHTDTNQNRCSVRASADSNHIPCVVLLNMFGNSKLEHPWGPGCSEKKGLVAVCFPQSYLYPQDLSA